MMIAFGVYFTDFAALTALISTVSWPPTARMSGFLDATPERIGVRSASGGNSEFSTTFSPASLAPLAKPAAASLENGSLAPRIAADVALGLPRSTMYLSALSAVRSTDGMIPYANCGLADQLAGDSAEPAMHGVWYLAQIGFIAICTPLV